MIAICNLPSYALDYDWVVAREDGGRLWFWGVYDTEPRAKAIAGAVDGFHFPVCDVVGI